MIRITDILDKAQEYLSEEHLEMIEKAYIFSATVHQGQSRLSGEPYLIHPLEVTGMLVDMKLDIASIITGMLHDTVEDTLTTIEEIEEAFGKEVAFLVEGLTKISKIKFSSQLEQQAENFRKMMLAMSDDIRILLVRLADRMHNMRTLEYQPENKQKYISRETLEVYAPLASRLGINWMKVELEDLSFKYLFTEDYFDLIDRVAKKKEERDAYAEEVKRIIRENLEAFHLQAEVEGRAKHFYSIFNKMNEQHINFDEVYDLTAFRIILEANEVKGCYEALSVVHALWKPVPGRFKDYIAMPKANNYRSLHTTVIGPYGERVEIQIRTREMHEWAEEGIAAHWRYKEGKVSPDGGEDHIKRLRELFELQQEHKDAREFMHSLKMALFPDEVYIFTPRGDVKAFPKGATPIDFAYSIHTDVGNQCVGAKVNRNIVPLKYKLQNGDTVDIITQPGHHPSKDWLKYAVTSRAISKIKQWIKTEERDKSIAIGRDVLEREFKKVHLKLNQAARTDEFKEILAEQSLATADDLLALIGYGKISAKYIVNRIMPEEEVKEEIPVEKQKKKTKKSADAGISITGVDDVMVRFARCCTPLPGDDVVGYITRGRGVSVHVATCPGVQEMDPERLVDVKWNIGQKQAFPVNIRVICIDKRGLLSELSNVISNLGINISSANIDTIRGENATCDFELDVSDLDQFNTLVSALRKLKSVQTIERLRGSLPGGKRKAYM
ncbi:MAG TPA: bifunctional (p)ppGpp synthetase/guanosine-3',5'-bis(diphosphate) 3'-pyrophosphohydrolase [Deltaproteobacteria bacterium]|nr:bifunctional (p)ppGpp synthetase/guanosine-3',5'-bis(diphosphate) 3'-pyrophosphohydrolase [Deltaproteobacteria bacterium]